MTAGGKVLGQMLAQHGGIMLQIVRLCRIEATASLLHRRRLVLSEIATCSV